MQQHAGIFRDDPAAERHVQALDERDCSAEFIDDAEKDRIAAVEDARGRPRPQRIERRSARRQRPRFEPGLDPALVKGGIGERRVAFGDRVFERLDREVRPVGLVGGTIVREHPHREQHRRALRVGRMREQLAAVPRDAQRQRRFGDVCGEIGERHAIAARAQRAHDAFGDAPGVERVGAAGADRRERLRQIGIAVKFAGPGDAAPQKHALRLAVALQQLDVRREIVRDHVGNDVAVARAGLGRREQFVQTARSVGASYIFPGANGSRNRHAQSAAQRQHGAVGAA